MLPVRFCNSWFVSVVQRWYRGDAAGEILQLVVRRITVAGIALHHPCSRCTQKAFAIADHLLHLLRREYLYAPYAIHKLPRKVRHSKVLCMNGYSVFKNIYCMVIQLKMVWVGHLLPWVVADEKNVIFSVDEYKLPAWSYRVLQLAFKAK
jgi:hypothetical protein